MKSSNILLGTIALLAASTSPALAEWRWHEEAPRQTETHIYEEPARTETRIYEERIEPSGRDYYNQTPRRHYQETYRESWQEPVVTNQEVFRDGRCDVTRTHLSNGSFNDERVCSRLLLPHQILIDRIGRHFDHLRGYDHYERENF